MSQNRTQRLQGTLENLVSGTPDITGAALVSDDGLIIGSVLPSGSSLDPSSIAIRPSTVAETPTTRKSKNARVSSFAGSPAQWRKLATVS